MQITRLPEYYVYEAEKELLASQAGPIAAHIPSGGVVVELGCGDSSKTAILLAELMRRPQGSNCQRGGVAGPGDVEDGSFGSGKGGAGKGCTSGCPPMRFVGVDVSAEALRQTACSLACLLPELATEQARRSGCTVGRGGCTPRLHWESNPPEHLFGLSCGGAAPGCPGCPVAWQAALDTECPH